MTPRQAVLFAQTMLLLPLASTLARLLVRLVVPSLMLALVFGGHRLRLCAANMAALELARLSWKASRGARARLLQRFRDEAYLVERKLLDRDEA
jgi:hypothetical protein